mgnify:CR=1 FL=1
MSDYEDNISDVMDDIEEDENDMIDNAEEIDNNESDSEYETYEVFDNDAIDNSIPVRNNFLNIYEITMLIGYRASQISNGARTFLDDEEEAKRLCNPILIAEEEFKRGLIPFDIIRHINVGRSTKNVCLDVGTDLHILDVGNMI